MNTYTYEKPLEWYIAKLSYLYEVISKLPDIRLGQRYDADILRIYSGPYKYRVITKNSKEWNSFYSIFIDRNSLQHQISILSQQLQSIYHTTYEKERMKFKILTNNNSPLSMNFYDSLIDDECTFPKTNQYEFDGHNFRSRFEMMAAQEIKSLQIPYKYDCGIQLSNRSLYPDFALGFPEFNRCVLFELLGSMDNPKYVNDSVEKLRDYSNNRILLESDCFLLCGTDRTMPCGPQIRIKLINIISALCSLYVIHL